jgi:hypothetical protein
MGGGAGKAGAGDVELELIKDRATLALMEWVRQGGGQIDSLAVAKVGPAKIRGVVALKVSVLQTIYDQDSRQHVLSALAF